MTKIAGLREDIQLARALQQQINQWLSTVKQQAKAVKTSPPTK